MAERPGGRTVPNLFPGHAGAAMGSADQIERSGSAQHHVGMKRSLALALAIGILLTSAVALGATPPAAAAATVPACAAGHLSARIAAWQGAVGSRIADVRIVNTSFAPCVLRDNPRVRLVSAHGAVMINGAAASTTAGTLLLPALGFLRTEVSASNYCGPAYAQPVTLAFVLPGTLGQVVAIPLSPADTSGVPPCNGAPGSAGHISMHAWHT